MTTFSLDGQTAPGQAALLPKNVSTTIWEKATAQSIVPSLATSAPIIIGENTFPIVSKRPAASIVGEGQNKPGSEIGLTSKTVKPIKAVVGLEFTMESLIVNPGGVLGLLETELAGALARQIDLAILHGRQASDGQPLTGGHEFINQTANRVQLSANGNVDAELWAGYGAVVATDNDFTGFAMDPRLIFQLANARDDKGRRLNPEIQMGSAVTAYAGQRAAVSKTVSGQIDASADTKVRGFGGDWDALKFGYSLQLATKRIEYGDPFGNGDLQARNSVAFMTEAIFGWAIMDLDAFVAYDEAPVEGA